MSKTTKRTIIEGVAWTSVGVWVTKVVAIINVILVLSNISVYEYGLVELVISIPALMGILSLPGLEVVVATDTIYERSKNNIQKAYYILTSYFVLRMVLGVVGFFSLFLLATPVEQYYNSDIGMMVRMVSVLFLLGPFRSLFHITFKLGLHFKALSAYSFLEEAGKLVVLLTILSFTQLNAVGVIIGYVSTDIIAMTVLFPFFVRYFKNIFKGVHVQAGGWRSPLYTLIAHGKWSIFASYIGMFGQNIRPWIIKLFLGTEMVGLFGLALGMYQHTASLLPISRVIGPIIPRYIDKPQSLYRLINSAGKYQLFSLLLSAAVMALVFPVLIQHFFESYADAYPLFLLLLFSFIPGSFSRIYEPVFHALKAQRNLFMVGIIRLVVILCTLPILLYLFGSYGIALEFFITSSVYMYERYKKMCKVLPGYSFSFAELYTFSDFDKMILDKVKEKLSIKSVRNR